ncbi:hypothetical protein BC936DRAFT_141980 [Jimgerdemannia flammicorona]|uniref:Uncharacterized protein n=1 Tax=Jimgerdemannia flammicorona TaxID=994334 RepID=A0A433A189_9FUNG|nr:hypothetical protein BC936DRAFT_141980 [Jimgerdemannia flammicorona]
MEEIKRQSEAAFWMHFPVAWWTTKMDVLPHRTTLWPTHFFIRPILMSKWAVGDSVKDYITRMQDVCAHLCAVGCMAHDGRPILSWRIVE